MSREVALFLGGSIHLNSDLSFFEHWDESHFYWMTSYNLGFNGMLEFQGSGSSAINLEIQIPVIALISRPESEILYKEVNPEFSWILNKLNENLKLTSLNKHLELNLLLSYLKRYSQGFGIRFFWNFRFINNSMAYSEQISMISHRFGLAFLF